MSNFQKVLRDIMEKHGLSQLALSRAIGYRQSQVSNWMRGKSKPGYDAIKALTEYFNVPAEYFLTPNPYHLIPRL